VKRGLGEEWTVSKGTMEKGDLVKRGLGEEWTVSKGTMEKGDLGT